MAWVAVADRLLLGGCADMDNTTQRIVCGAAMGAGTWGRVGGLLMDAIEH